MPETRFIEEYKDSKLINKIPYEVSDEQLAIELKHKRIRDIKTKQTPLTMAEAEEAIKFILERLI